jgi:hypothetical protein
VLNREITNTNFIVFWFDPDWSSNPQSTTLQPLHYWCGLIWSVKRDTHVYIIREKPSFNLNRKIIQHQHEKRVQQILLYIKEKLWYGSSNFKWRKIFSWSSFQFTVIRRLWHTILFFHLASQFAKYISTFFNLLQIITQQTCWIFLLTLSI